MLTKYIDHERLIHSIKTVIACLIGLLITKNISYVTDQWIVITIIIVMCAQLYVGSVLQKAYFRFLGTLVGCFFAAATLILLGQDTLSVVVAITIASFIFSYIATARENLVYTGTLGAVTTAIVMLSPHPTLVLAFGRFIEISIGILIATLVSQFVLPIHARTHLQRAQVAALKQLHDYYTALIINRDHKRSLDEYHEMDEQVVTFLLKQRQLAKESARERLGITFNPTQFMHTLYYEREMLRAITFMNIALTKAQQLNHVILTSLESQHFNELVLQALNTLIKKLESPHKTHDPLILPDFAALETTLLNTIQHLQYKNQVPINGFLFATDILLTSLLHLANSYHVTIANKKSETLNNE